MCSPFLLLFSLFLLALLTNSPLSLSLRLVVGIFVNINGCRTRKQELLWHSPPNNISEFSLTLNRMSILLLFITVYRQPYLIVFCDSGLEVINIDSAKWEQTIPIRKVTVTLLLSMTTDYSPPLPPSPPPPPPPPPPPFSLLLLPPYPAACSEC